MLEKRNPIRRNLTGGLALGLFSGLLLALPDALAGLFAFPGLSLWGVVALLFFFDGVVAAGMLGFMRGLTQAASLKFSQSGSQSRTAMVWSRRSLAVVWTSSIMPYLPFSRPTRWFVALGLSVAAAWVLPEIVRHLGLAAEDKHRKSPVIIAACLAIAAGFFCSSHWGAGRLFAAPGFWFLTAFFLHMGSLFFLARLIRTHSRHHATWLSPLAGPGVVSIVLVLAMLGGSFARTRLDRVDPAQLKGYSSLAHGLHSGQEEAPIKAPALAESSGSDREADATGPPVASKPAPATMPLDFNQSVLIVTSMVTKAPAFEHGFRVTGGVAASLDPALSLGSFFTGRHLGIWARVAPHWPAPGPSWPQAIAAHHRVEVLRFGRFKGAKTPYFRELPGFGFPDAFEMSAEFNVQAASSMPSISVKQAASEMPPVSSLSAFLKVTDLISRPFFAWVHLDAADPGISAGQVQKAATDGRFAVIWLHLPPGQAATVSVFDPSRTEAAVDFEAPFSVAGVLPSLMPIPGHRTEFSSAPFPEVRHPRVTVDHGANPEGTVHDVRRLTRRIRNAVNKRPSERWPSSPEKLVLFLETLICRGQLEPAELRRIIARVKPFPDRRDLRERMDLLLWRLGRLERPPLWAADVLSEPWVRTWLQWTKGGQETSVTDPRVLAWTLALSGGRVSTPLIEVCPGVQHSLPLLPGL